MAEKKQLKIISVGAWDGPHKKGKYTNYFADATLSDGNKESDVIVQVGSEGMTKKFTVGETYTGKAVYKDDEKGKWVISFMAGDNPGLAAPKEEYHGGGGGRGYGGPKGGNESFALSYAKDVYVGLAAAGHPVEAETIGKDIVSLAEEFMPFLDGKHAAKPEAPAAPVPEGDDDDVPF